MARGRKSPLGIEGTSVAFTEPGSNGRMTVAKVRARDESGAYASRRFRITSWRRDGSPVLPEEAEAWARATRKDFVKGIAVAGVATVETYADILITGMAGEVTDGRVRLVRAVADGLIAAGIVDMRSESFAARCRAWVNSLRDGWSLPADAPNAHKTSRKLSDATKNKIRIIIHQVAQLAMDKGRLARNPLDSDEFRPFKESKHLKPLFSVAELRQMVSDEARDATITAQRDLEAEIEAQGGKRMVAIAAIAKERGRHWTTIYNILRRPAEPDPWWLACCLMVYTGCRADEAMHLRWEWIRWAEGVITLKLADDYENKSDAERLIPLDPELSDILRPLAKPHGHILPGHVRAGGSGVRTTKGSEGGKGAKDYSNALRLYLKRIGIDPGERTAHSLRHCYITMKIAREDCNPDRLRKAVGHGKITTTLGYGEQSQLYQAEVDRWPDRTLWLRRPLPVVAKQGKAVVK
jgi:integrase